MRIAPTLILATSFSAMVLVACATSAPIATPTPSLVAAATPTKAPTATPTKRPLVKAVWVTASNSLSVASTFVAMGKGLFRDEGLDVELVLSGGGPKSTAAVAGGSADFGTVSGESFLPAVAERLPVLIIAQTNRVPNVLTMRKDVAERLGIAEKSPLEARARALKGLTITATSPTGATGRLPRLMMQLVGLDPDRDAEFTYISSGADMVTAMQQKRVDVISAAVPFALAPTAQGFGIVIFALGRERIPGLEPGYITLGTSRDVADKRPDVLEAAVRAHWRALRLINANPDEAAQTIKQLEAFRELDLSVLQLSLQYTLFSDAPTVTDDVIRVSAEIVNAERPPDQQISLTFDQVATNRFVEAAKKQLGF